VVPDAFDINLSVIDGGFQEHFDNHSRVDWALLSPNTVACDGVLQQPAHSDCDALHVSCLEAAPGQHGIPAAKAAAVQQQYMLPVAAQQQQLLQPQQPHVKLEPQWAPTQQQVSGFMWPCPEELRTPYSSSLTAAPLVPLGTPNMPAAIGSSSSSSASDDEVIAGQTQPQPVNTSPKPRSRSRHIRASSPAGSKGSSSAGSVTAAAVGGSSRQWGLPVRSRAEAVARYRLKRARRSSAGKVVRYQRRKEYAEQRPRVRGRFVKATDLQQQQQQQLQA